jgi:hypothetical protein
MLTDSEKKIRQYRVNFAINNNAIEGLFVSDELKELLKLWVNDEITLEEVEKKNLCVMAAVTFIPMKMGVKNKLGIKSSKELENLERDISTIRLIQLNNPH